MQPYKLMVIDDELEKRKTAYESVLHAPQFELIFVVSPTHLETIVNTTPVDGYIVDAILGTGVWSGIGNAANLFSGLLRNPPRLAPVFLVSRKWGAPEAMNVLNALNRRARQGIEVLRYLAWQEFEAAIAKSKKADIGKQELSGTVNAIVEALRNKILDDLLVWHERSSFRPNPDHNIVRILLLADVQYGDAHTSASAVFDEQWLVRALNRDGLIPDLVVLAGDIGCTGDPADYRIAKNKLEENLFEYMWGANHLDNWRERIILVPGNHDVNLRIAACDRNDWDRDGKKWKDKTSSITSKITKSPEPINYNDYALEPFRQFAKDITGSRLWDNPRISCRVDRRFELSGIRFYLFNSVSGMTIDTPKKAEFSEKAIGRITLELGKEDKPENFFSIAVSHHGIQMGRKSREQIENWDEVGQQFFNEHQIKLWMFGHYHEFDTQEVKLEEGKKLGLIQSPTLKIRPEEAVRGFSLIELERSGEQVVAVKVYPYTIGKKGVNEKEKPKPIVVWKKS